MELVLEATGLRFSWPRVETSLLREVDLEVLSGGLTAISGANGAGKTTLVRILAGLLDPAQGRIALRGVDPATDRPRYQRRLGLVAAGNSGLYGRLPVERHLRLAAGLGLLASAASARAVEEALRRFALSDLAGQRVDRLSMGQRQRVRLAMGMLHDPDLILLDEPQTSLDPEGRALLAAAIEARLAAGAGVLWVSQTGERHAREPDRLLTLADGRLAPA